MCYFEYLGRDAESLQRCFARTENVNSRTWGYKNTIVGTSRHPNKNYWYNLVWTDNSGNIITNFIIEEGINYRIDAYLNKSSRLYKNSVNSNDLKLVRSELEAGYVFNDNDERISSNRLELDTCTHYLETITNKFSKSGDFLVYSKYIDNGNRLNYEIHKPEMINGLMTCKIVLDNFIGHHFRGYLYGENSSNKDYVLQTERSQAKSRFGGYKRYSDTGEILGEFIFPDWF